MARELVGGSAGAAGTTRGTARAVTGRLSATPGQCERSHERWHTRSAAGAAEPAALWSQREAGLSAPEEALGLGGINRNNALRFAAREDGGRQSPSAATELKPVQPTMDRQPIKEASPNRTATSCREDVAIAVPRDEERGRRGHARIA